MPNPLRPVLRAVRSWARTPTLALAALATLTVALGANTALFSVLWAVALAPLPYPDPDALVRIWQGRPVSIEIFDAIDSGTSAFAATAIHSEVTTTWTSEAAARRLPAATVSQDHFEVLGIHPAAGRSFSATDHMPGATGVAIVSHRFWQETLGGSGDVLGRTLDLDGRLRTIIGVLPATYRALRPDWNIWLPLEIDPASELYTDWLSYRMIGRLAPGATPRSAEAECQAAMTPVREIHPDRSGLADPVPVVRLHESMLGDVRSMLWLLFAAVSVVLLIACTNVANLMLAGLGGRARELAIRSALGADRRRLIAQLLGEGLVLAAGGGALGLLSAAWGLSALRSMFAAHLPRAETITLDANVLAFNLAATLAAGLLSGTIPAWRASRKGAGSLLVNAANRGRSSTRGALRLGSALIAGEVALALLLVSGAGLLLKNFWLLQHIDPGFERAGIQTMHLDVAPERYDDPQRSLFFSQIEDELASLPGVESVGGINLLPMTSGNVIEAYRHADMAANEEPRPVATRIVTPGYFETLGVRVVEGRDLRPGDRPDTEAVGLVNEAFARILLADAPDLEVLGREIQYDDASPWFRIVGIVPDQRQRGLDRRPEPMLYRPLAQETWDTSMVYVLRTGESPISLEALQGVVFSIDAGVASPSVEAFTTIVQRSLGDHRQLTILFALFAAVALLLGGLGVYGVTAHAVTERRHEYGVRLALGARPSEVVRGALRSALHPVATGLVIGVPLSLLASGLLAQRLHQVEPTDPTVHLAVVVFLGSCAALAGYLPSRRCAAVDPVETLRGEG